MFEKRRKDSAASRSGSGWKRLRLREAEGGTGERGRLKEDGKGRPRRKGREGDAKARTASELAPGQKGEQRTFEMIGRGPATEPHRTHLIGRRSRHLYSLSSSHRC